MLLASSALPRPGQLFPRLELPKLELCFKDGNRIWLHTFQTDQLRRSVDDNGESLQFDLCDLCSGLADDFQAACPVDRPAIIFFTLRHQFPSLDKFLAAVRASVQAAKAH